MGKNLGICRGKGDLKMRCKSPLGPGKGPKKNFENLNFGKKRIGKFVARCRRIDWYIVFRNVGRTEQRGVVCRSPS